MMGGGGGVPPRHALPICGLSAAFEPFGLIITHRACLAAESWKRLYPDGAPNSGQFGKRDGKSKNILTFETFAKNSFKVSEAYAKQALAILKCLIY
jgi:hypothetical protein